MVQKTSINAPALTKLEKEYFFGPSIDIFKSYHTVKIVCNILKKLGLNNSSDSDWQRTVAKYLTLDELSLIYDKILPRERREAMSNGRFRNPPELGDDDPDDIINYLARKLTTRKKVWTLAAECYERRVKQYEAVMASARHTPGTSEKRFKEMQELFSLSDMETNALIALFLCQSNYIDLGDFDLNRFRHGEKVQALGNALGILEVEVAELLGDDKNLRKFGLIDDDLDLDRTFLSYLSGISSKPLAERFWTKYEGEVLPWEFHGTLAEKNGKVLKDMIAAKPSDKGLSALLYGVPGSGKSSFAASLAKDMGKDLYFIAQNDNDNRRLSYSPAFRYAALAVAQKQLDPQKSILVLDECDKLVENSGLGGGLLAFFGLGSIGGSRDGEAKGQLNSVMDNNKFTILWICNSKQDAIDPSSRRRFDYNILFDDLSATARQHIWENALEFHNCQGKLTEEFLKRVSARYPVNPGGIALAVKNASWVCNADPAKDFETEVMTFLKAHCSLLGISESPDEMLAPARDYSLDGLNIKSGIKLPRLIEVCQNFLKSSKNITANRDQPRMNLLLFGVPGAGKTEFVKYLAQALGMKLNIKNASNLLSCYHGVTEQRISEAFAEAAANNEILFIDEADSMLSSRESAVRNFEVTQVNTLLTEMERFNGIFICSTNMVQKMDPAALRRFSFRLHFDYLLDEGKECFFKTYFTQPMGLAELSDEEREKLHAVSNLTPSDFRNTRQQFFYLQDSDLTNSEIIEALAAEVASKSGEGYKGLGQIVTKMGF